MSNADSFVPFKREDHVYHNEAFAELCKDAVRAFNGTPVCGMPPPRFTGSGVYAIYCTAKRGIYERYGNKVNRMGYNVPIYVGKAVPKGWREENPEAFCSLPIKNQILFWQGEIEKTIGVSANDFHCRISQIDEQSLTLIDGMYDTLIDAFHPVWNAVFCSCINKNDVALRWKMIHSIRFCSRADKASQEELKRLLKVA